MNDEENQMESVQGAADASMSDSEMVSSPLPEDNGLSEEGSVELQLPNTEVVDEFGVINAPGSDPTAAKEENAEETVLNEEHQILLAGMENEITTLKVQLEERTNQFARMAADFDNYRKRTQREREELELKVKCDAINELLPVVDNFERARSQIKPQTDAETTIHKSYQSVYKQLVDCLKRVGVAPMRSEGKEFDPNLHEAVMRQPTSEFPEGVVMEEMQRGYMLGDRVLRHALVKVAALPEPGEDSATAEHSEPGS